MSPKHGDDEEAKKLAIKNPTIFSQDRAECYYRKSPISQDKKHHYFTKPLMVFFQNCIDFERRNEINKQELVLSEDFSIYNIFKALAGPGRKFLALCDMQTILAKHFECAFPYKELKLAILR